MCDKVYTIDEIRAIATPIAKSHGVAALYLFGSYSRGDATSESDLDFRIEKGQIRTLFQLGQSSLRSRRRFPEECRCVDNTNALA